MKLVLFITTFIFSTSAFAVKQIYLDRLLDTGVCHYCSLNDAELSGKDFTNGDLSESQLQNINLSNAKLVNVWFSHSKIQGANFENADLSNTLMDYALLNGANLKGANLTNAKMNFADLSDVDLTNAILKDTVLRGVIFCNTTMPDGTINNSGCPAKKVEEKTNKQ